MTIDEIREKFPMYNQLSDEDLATRINSKYEDVGEIELIWEGMKAGIPELWHGANSSAQNPWKRWVWTLLK